ncbi:DUF2218 domain-containing protein [Paracoccus sp. KCTC 42845]|uniref:DUF2218 domain-containing protein n=2 Tax=Paracoccus aerius TaxID=1915382 RepID=A0ABS1S9T9_9RHOB|nr:DUF2218 domain-containing protein [Paracoccus aerius]
MIGETMTTSTARVATEHASRYLQQLCKHWSHRFTVEFDPNTGRIAFGDGQHVDLSATEAALVLQVSDDAGDGLERLQDVVAKHLQRFAFREDLIINWTRSDDA